MDEKWEEKGLWPITIDFSVQVAVLELQFE